MMPGNIKEAYNTLKALTKTQQHKPAVIEDSSENILKEITAVLNRWTEYGSGLHSYELHPDTPEQPDPNARGWKPTWAEGKGWRGCAQSDKFPISW